MVAFTAQIFNTFVSTSLEIAMVHYLQFVPSTFVPTTDDIGIIISVR